MTKQEYIDRIIALYGGNSSDYVNLLELALIACADYGITRKEIRQTMPFDGLFELPSDFHKVISLKTVSNHDIVFEVIEQDNKRYLKLLSVKVPSVYSLVTSYERLVFPEHSNINIDKFVLVYSFLASKIDNDFILALDYYMQYLIINRKISSMVMDGKLTERASSISDSDGNITQTINFGSNTDLINSYKATMLSALDNFLALSSIPYITRG